MKIITTVFLVLLVVAARAQNDSITLLHAFPVTDYMLPGNDSVKIVQVQLPDASPVHIPEKLLGVLRHRYVSGRPYDTAMIGYGRCYLIKGDYYYFGLTLSGGQQPTAGDLLYAKVKVKCGYNGLLLKLAAHQVQLQQVDESLAYRMQDVYFWKSSQEEATVLDSLVSDIRYTGSEMLQQMPGSNQLIEGGLFDGKKLFDAMQTATRTHLIEFLKYIIARPQKYAGSTWKISEIFATWMVSKTPQVVN